MRISWPLLGLCKSAPAIRVLTLAVVSAACLLSTIFLQPAPVTHAASLNSSVASNVSTTGVYVYLNHRKLHNFADCSQKPVESCPVLEYINKGTYQALCQQEGETVSDVGYTNDWWTELQDPNFGLGWISNIYLQGGHTIAGVPVCNGNVPYIPPAPFKAVCSPSQTYLARIATTNGTFCYSQSGSSAEVVPNVTYVCAGANTTVTYTIQYANNFPGITVVLPPGQVRHYGANYTLKNIQLPASAPANNFCY